MNKTIFYAIAEPDFIFKQHIIVNISNNSFYKLAYSTNDGYELISSFNKQPLDLIILNAHLPILSGLQVIKFIRLLNKDLPIIYYTDVYEPDIAHSLIPFKKITYCQKKADIILKNMSTFLRDGYIDNTIYKKEWAKERYKNIHELITENLSGRFTGIEFTAVELRLIKLTYKGFTNKEIAPQMNLSDRTVDTYLNNLMKRIELRSKVDLVRFTIEQDILQYILMF